MGTFQAVDEWLRRLLSSPSSVPTSDVRLGRLQKALHVALAFFGSLVLSWFLFGWLILLAILISFTAAGCARRGRRRYLLIGVSLAAPIELWVWYAVLGVH